MKFRFSVEELYYNDNFFEAIDGHMINLHLVGEKLGGGYKEEEKQDIEQIQERLRESRIISYPVKQNKGRCGHCGKPLHQGKLCNIFCQSCGSYNTAVQPPSGLKFLQYMERMTVEEILAEASISASNPAPFLAGLNLIETITSDRKSYFEKIVKIRVKTNEPNQHSYHCGACGFKINSDTEKIVEPIFCPNCGIPFRRTRRITQQEDGGETTIFTP